MSLPAAASALRAALEEAVGFPADVSTPGPDRTRLTVRLPADIDEDRWRAALHAVQTAPDWGSSDAMGGLVIWAEVCQ